MNIKKSDQGIRVRVWDLRIRLFHWLLVSGFLIAYFTAQLHLKTIHIWSGYGLCFLWLARIYWGFFGSRYARFSTFLFSPRESLRYILSLGRPHPQHYVGHNPAGALMVFALLASLFLLLTSGIVVLSVIDCEGPLLGLGNLVSDNWSYGARSIHDNLSNMIWVMVGLHVLGVALASAQHGENLLWAMLTGWKVLPAGRTSFMEPTRITGVKNEV